MKKRIISMILSIVMVIGMLPVSVFAAEADNLQNFTKRNTYTNETFDDVQRNDWFYENVKSVYELGLMQGKGGKRFDTESGVTIAETLTIAARLHSIYYTGSDAFAASNPWYQVYVDYCAANGVASVNSETYSQPASRAEFVMILTNALPVEVFAEINKVADNAIPDVNIDDAYGAAVYKMYRAGIMIGNDDIGTFAPSSEIKRSEVAAIVTRMVDVSLRESIQLGNEYTVTFNMNGHGKQIDPQTVVEGYTAEKPADPTKASYTFKGWYTQKSGGQQFDFDTPITKDITLYAHWELNSGWTGGLGWNDDYIPTYTVTFDANGSDVENLPAAQRVKAGARAIEPVEPTKLIHDFDGWYTDSSCTNLFDLSTPITSNITLYAKWDITIYSKPLDESHVKTGILEYEGEEYEGQYVDNELIIVVKDGVTREEVEELVAEHGGTIVGQIPFVGFYQILFVEKDLEFVDIFSLFDVYKNDLNVSNVYFNTLTNINGSSFQNAWYPNDTYGMSEFDDLERFSYVWGNKQLLTWGLRASGLPQAWHMTKQVNHAEAVRVGVIDTGFYTNHDDLDIVTYGTGYGQDHGTHVAGIIGACTDNELGVAGITLNSSIYGTAVSKGVPIAELCAYMSALIELNCKVINVSLGHKESDLTLAEKILTSAQAGTLADVFYKYIDAGYDFLVVTAAANNGEYDHDVNYANAITKLSEPLYRESIIVVGNASYNNGHYERNPSSAYEGSRVEVMAPGTYIYSTISNDAYGYKSGTSMASPFVAGVAALIKETIPQMSMSEIKDIIITTANISVDKSDVNMINAADAMNEALRRAGITIPTIEDVREIELYFVDESTNEAIEDTMMTLCVLDYAGPHNHKINGEEENIPVANAKSKIYLDDGVWRISFYSENYYSDDLYISVTEATRLISIRMTALEDSPIDPDQPGGEDPVIPPVGTGYTVSGRLVSAADGIGIADMSVSLVNNSNFYTATTDGKGYFKFSNVAASPVYAFESGDGTTYEYYIDTDVVVSGDIDLGTIQLTPANAPSKTIRIHFVDSDSGEILKISDIFYDKSYIGIDHNGLAEGEQYISGDFIDGSKGNNAFTVSDDRELVFTKVPVFGDDIWGNYYLSFDSGEKSHAIPERYIIATLDLIENSSGEWEVEVELDRLTLIVGDVTVTEENANDILGDGTAKYEYSGNKLTFTNANITADTVIYTDMAYLNIVIPGGTVTHLSNNNMDNTSVIYSESGFVGIDNGNAEGNGTLYISGCKETITNGSSVYDEYTQFCIRADEVRILSTDIIFADAWGAIRSEDGNIHISDSSVSEKTPYSVKAYLFNSARNIDITCSTVTDSSDSGATIFAHDDISINSSSVELTGSNCLLSYAGKIWFANNTYAHIISIDTVSEMDYDLIEAALGIRMVSFISSDPADIVKIITPTDGVVQLTTDGVYVIRNSDGSRTNEILIKCPD